MFEFLRECDENLYQEIINEVEPNMVNNACLPIIQSKFERTLKLILKESGINLQNNKPTMKDILNHKNFKSYLINNDLMSADDIERFWVVNNAANAVKHGGKVEVTTELKGRALLYLFNFCKNYCQFITGKMPDVEFDIEGTKNKTQVSHPTHLIRSNSSEQEIIDALERLEEKYHGAGGYGVREILFEMGIKTNPDEEKTLRKKLRKLMDKIIYPEIKGAGNEDVIYTPGGKGSGTYRLSKYRGE